MAVSTALFSAATGVSRIAGLAREIAVAAIFGIRGSGINAFTVAFQVPNLVRALVADAALGAAFVPIFNELLERGERERAWRVASTVFWLAFAGLSVVTFGFMVLAPQIMALFGYHGSLGVSLARILFPTVVLLGLSGIVVAILNAFEEFFVPAIAPVAWNAVIIGVLAATIPVVHSTSSRLYAYAFGILLGTLVQFALPLPWLRGRGGHIGFHFDIRDEAVRRVFVLMLPVTIGLGLINVNVLIDSYFATRVNKDESVAAIDKAFRIYMLPQGMFSVAVAAVLFPALSRYAAGRDLERFRNTVGSGLRQIAFLLLPAAAVTAVLAEPMVRLLYQRGNFTASQTTLVAQVLVAFCVGLAFNGAMLLLNRSFFSLQEAWIPTSIAGLNLVANGVLDAIFYRPFGTWGIALSTSIVNILGVVALVWFLRRRLGALDGRRTLSAVARIAVASAASAVVGYPVWRGLDALLGQAFAAQLLSLLGALSAASAVYIGASMLLRVQEVRLLADVVRRRR
jgi:putative peptidoglycan lipid II flippase